MIIAHPRFDWKLLQLKMTDMVFVIMTVLAFSLFMGPAVEMEYYSRLMV